MAGGAPRGGEGTGICLGLGVHGGPLLVASQSEVAGRELRDSLQATRLSLGPQLTSPCGLADVSLGAKF